MSRSISQQELSRDSAAILREVRAGHSVVVTDAGVPVAEIRPIFAQNFVPRAMIAEAAARASRIDARRWRDDLDSVVEPYADG